MLSQIITEPTPTEDSEMESVDLCALQCTLQSGSDSDSIVEVGTYLRIVRAYCCRRSRIVCETDYKFLLIERIVRLESDLCGSAPALTFTLNLGKYNKTH